MASQHSGANQGVHYRLPRDLVADLKAEVSRRGWTEREIVAAAIRREIDNPSPCPRCHDTNPHHCERCVEIETRLARLSSSTPTDKEH